MLTKERIAELRLNRRCVTRDGLGGKFKQHEHTGRLCDCQVLELLDAVETLTEAIEAKVKLDAFGISSNGILCEALAKVYGEQK